MNGEINTAMAYLRLMSKKSRDFRELLNIGHIVI